MMMLTTYPEKAGEKPTKEFPRIYGILMDWPIGEQTATVFSTSTLLFRVVQGVACRDERLCIYPSVHREPIPY